VRIYLNDQPFELIPGMTVRHALEAAGLVALVAQGRKVYDAWGNEVGLDGALAEGMRLQVK
jgi:hypothetical protein